MADATKRLTANVDGNFFVDATCINCDTCRQLAPTSFREEGEYSAVVHQPEGDAQLHQAYQALLACPVGSIGTVRSEKTRLQAARDSFPLQLEGGVYYNGFNSEKSFGGNSFFIQHHDGNWLIDSPRYLKQLVEAFEQKGGITYIFLTHEDDVADSARYAKQCADADTVPDAEWIMEGRETVQLRSAVPGHPGPGPHAWQHGAAVRCAVPFQRGSPLVGPGKADARIAPAAGLEQAAPSALHRQASGSSV